MDTAIAILGVIAVGALGAALKTWRDVAVLKSSVVPSAMIYEIRERIVRIEDSVIAISRSCEMCRTKKGGD